MGWSGRWPGVAPNHSGARRGVSPSATRRFSQTWFTRSVLPVGEEADAVGAGDDLLEVGFQLRQGQVLVHVLPHGERRQQVERQAA